MSQSIQQKLSNIPAMRWTALVIVSVTMMFGYFFTDVMSPLEPLLTAEMEEIEFGLGWTSSEYGFFSGAYGLLNVYLLLLFFGGLILDKFGIRFTGITSTALMFIGAVIKWWACANTFEGTVWVPFGGVVQMQVAWASLGFAIYGVGCEIAGVTVSKVIVKWFTGHELALAMGLQVALARIGTALALGFSLPIAKALGGVHTSVALGAALLCIGMISFIVYCIMDKKEDASATNIQSEPEEGLRFADLKVFFDNTIYTSIILIWGVIAILILINQLADYPVHFITLLDQITDKNNCIVGYYVYIGIPVLWLLFTLMFYSNRGFWCITLLCLMFYGGVFPFLKFATKFMIIKYGIDDSLAGFIPAILPIGTIFLTIFFGGIYDKYGRGATLMLLGSILLTIVHIIFALPINNWIVAVCATILLGIAFGLVPSAMWPSVPKIIPMKLLGTAYALIFYIQNIGLAMIPMWIGNVNDSNTDPSTGIIDYTQSMSIFASYGVISIILSLLLLYLNKKKGYGLEEANIKK